MIIETGATRATDEDAARIAHLYERMMDGWNRGDAEAFAAPFAEACDFIAFDGTHLATRRAVADFHAAIFAKWLRGTRLVGRAERVRFLTDDVATVHTTSGTIMRGQARPAPERNSLQTLVARRAGDGWELTNFQLTRIRPIGHSAASGLLWTLFDGLWRLCRINPPLAY